MKYLLLLIFAVVRGSAFADGTPPDAIEFIKRRGELSLSDGSSLYRFSGDGRFFSIPAGLSGRTMEGTWREGKLGHLVAVAQVGFRNGYQSLDDYRRIEFYIGRIQGDAPVEKVVSFGQSFSIYRAYFFIDQITKISNPGSDPATPDTK